MAGTWGKADAGGAYPPGTAAMHNVALARSGGSHALALFRRQMLSNPVGDYFDRTWRHSRRDWTQLNAGEIGVWTLVLKVELQQSFRVPRHFGFLQPAPHSDS